VNSLRLFGQLLGQRQHSDLHGRQRRMEVQHSADVAALQLLLVVGVAEEGQGHAVSTQGRLDDVGDVLLLGFLIEVVHVLAGDFLVAGQIVIGAVSDAPELAPAEGEQELKVGCRLGIEGQLFLVVIPCAEEIFLHAEILQPLHAVILPVLEPLEVGVRLAEELQLHLLELSGAESEVSGRDLVAEGLSDLGDAEGQFLSGGALHVLEVDEDALGSLRAEIDHVLRVLGDALEGLEHQVELTDVGPVGLAAGRAGDVVLADKILHLLMTPAVDGGC